MEMHGDGVDELEIQQRERELEEGSKASTSFDQWEVHSMEGQISKANPEAVYEHDGDQGLSKSFRISIIVGSVLIMIAVILAISVFLPRTSKERRGRNLVEHGVSSEEIRLACEATQFRDLWISSQPEIVPNVTVSKDDGSSESSYSSIQAAVDSAPNDCAERFTIHIRGGVYEEIVRIPRSKSNLMLVGDGISQTVITGNRTGTPYGSATLGVKSDGFVARDMTFKNSGGGVAVRVDSDMSAFQNCAFIGHRYSVNAHVLRQLYTECRIEGTSGLQLMFGNAAALLSRCHVVVRPSQSQSWPSSSPSEEPRCRIPIPVGLRFPEFYRRRHETIIRQSQWEQLTFEH